MKLIYLNSNFALTLGYLNPALNNPALLVGSDRKYENRSKYKNKTQTAVINIVSYHRCLCYIFLSNYDGQISLTLPSPASERMEGVGLDFVLQVGMAYGFL